MPAKKMKDGKRWYCTFYYDTWTGERKRKKKEGFSTKRDAEKYEQEYLDNLKRSPDMPFSVLFEKYLEDRKVNTKESTYATREVVLKKHILPYFKKPINEISPNDIREWQNEIKKQNYSDGYLRFLNAQLVSIFNFAVKYYDLGKSPTQSVKLMGSRSKSLKFWELDEFNMFQENCQDEELKWIVEMLFYTGLRIGELTALSKDDFDGSSIRINKTLYRISGEDVIGPPKTKGSVRNVKLPDHLKDKLEAYISKLYDPSRLFPQKADTLYRKLVTEADHLGLPEITLQGLRHSHASLLINLGVGILGISKRLGHDSVKTTLDTYSHLYSTADDDIAQLLSETQKDPDE